MRVGSLSGEATAGDGQCMRPGKELCSEEKIDALEGGPDKLYARDGLVPPR